jgi:predicted RNA methylase
MLKDTVRTLAYRDAIEKNKDYFNDKVVLDVGCGTGVLSYFSKVYGGARKVYGVDDSNMIKMAARIMEGNGVSTDDVVLMRGKMENLVIPEKVDIIVSEWMGYGLLFESMLPTVLHARDRFMNPGGTMWPNKCSMFAELVEDRRLDFWNDVYGINMDVMKNEALKELCKDAIVENVDETTVCSNRGMMWDCNLNTVRDEELDYDTVVNLQVRVPMYCEACKSSADVIPCVRGKPSPEAQLRAEKGEIHLSGCTESQAGWCKKCSTCVNKERPVTVTGMTISFDIGFDLGLANSHAVTFSTACQAKTTHWYQTQMFFEPSTVPTLVPGESIEAKIRVEREKLNHRDISFLVEWKVVGRKEGSGDGKREYGKQKWVLVS